MCNIQEENPGENMGQEVGNFISSAVSNVWVMQIFPFALKIGFTLFDPLSLIFVSEYSYPMLL